MAACVFDATFMLLLTDDLALAPISNLNNQTLIDDGTGARDRLNYLLETLDDERTDVVVPTPVLTELLSSARADVAATLDVFRRIARIRVEGFGYRAAIECGEMLRRTGGESDRGRRQWTSRRTESECPGYCGAQDTFYVGTLKGVGRIYQQTFIDTTPSWRSPNSTTARHQSPLPIC